MKTSFLFVAVLSLAASGCKAKSAGNAYCAAAISHSMALSKTDMEKALGMDAKMMQKMAELGVQRCKDDKWPAAATKCMTDARTMTDAQGCYGKLTQEQQDKMRGAAMEMARASYGGDSAGSGSGGAGSASSPVSGSADTGSGSSGSAAAPK